MYREWMPNIEEMAMSANRCAVQHRRVVVCSEPTLGSGITRNELRYRPSVGDTAQRIHTHTHTFVPEVHNVDL